MLKNTKKASITKQDKFAKFDKELSEILDVSNRALNGYKKIVKEIYCNNLQDCNANDTFLILLENAANTFATIAHCSKQNIFPTLEKMQKASDSFASSRESVSSSNMNDSSTLESTSIETTSDEEPHITENNSTYSDYLRLIVSKSCENNLKKIQKKQNIKLLEKLIYDLALTYIKINSITNKLKKIKLYIDLTVNNTKDLDSNLLLIQIFQLDNEIRTAHDIIQASSKELINIIDKKSIKKLKKENRYESVESRFNLFHYTGEINSLHNFIKNTKKKIASKQIKSKGSNKYNLLKEMIHLKDNIIQKFGFDVVCFKTINQNNITEEDKEKIDYISKITFALYKYLEEIINIYQNKAINKSETRKLADKANTLIIEKSIEELKAKFDNTRDKIVANIEQESKETADASNILAHAIAANKFGEPPKPKRSLGDGFTNKGFYLKNSKVETQSDRDRTKKKLTHILKEIIEKSFNNKQIKYSEVKALFAFFNIRPINVNGSERRFTVNAKKFNSMTPANHKLLRSNASITFHESHGSREFLDALSPKRLRVFLRDDLGIDLSNYKDLEFNKVDKAPRKPSAPRPRRS